MSSEDVALSTAQQLMCACITAVVRLEISCCASVTLLLCSKFVVDGYCFNLLDMYLYGIYSLEYSVKHFVSYSCTIFFHTLCSFANLLKNYR